MTTQDAIGGSTPTVPTEIDVGDPGLPAFDLTRSDIDGRCATRAILAKDGTA
eukprot:gene25135-24928_t